MGAVYAGWLTKSPEDRKGLFSLFTARQQWRRRYFVLYAAPITSSSSPCSSSPSSTSSFPSSCTEEGSGTWTGHASSSSPVLIYYADETMTVQKGSIDLENCEEIIDHVESCYYRHLFLLKTVSPQRGRQRTYYLAADSSDDVTHWVKKLHSTLNLYEDKLFTSTVLSITESGSGVTGIIATVSNLEVHSESSKTNSKKPTDDESLSVIDPYKAAPVRQLSHVHWLALNSQTSHKCLDLVPNNAGLCDANSGISVSKPGTKVTDQKLSLPFKPNVSAEARSTDSVSVESNSVESGPSSAVIPVQSSALQNEASSGNTCTGQTGAKYCKDWPQFVRELLDDGDDSQATERNDRGRKGKAEGKSVFYVCNTSAFSPNTKANPTDAQKGRRHNASESTGDEAPAYHPSNQTSPEIYLRITKGSHRYKSRKKRSPNVASLF